METKYIILVFVVVIVVVLMMKSDNKQLLGVTNRNTIQRMRQGQRTRNEMELDALREYKEDRDQAVEMNIIRQSM